MTVDPTRDGSLTPFDFGRMIAPTEPAAFFREYWDQRPLILARQSPAYYSTLCSPADIDRILTSSDLRYPAVRLIRNGPDLPPESFTHDLRSRRFVFNAACDVDRILREYQRGATILLQRFERSWRPVADLCRSLEATFYHPVDANVYLTPRSAQGFGAHYDTHDVFILQIAGVKHWRLYEAPGALPLQSQPFVAADAPAGSCSHAIDVHAGDLLYLPRGTVHEALTSDSASVHVTIGITPHTWADVLIEAVSAGARTDRRMRESVPLGAIQSAEASAALAERFKGLLGGVSESVRVQDVLDTLTERFLATRRPPLDGHLRQIDDLPNLTLHAVVERRRDLMFRLVCDGAGVTLTFHRKRIRYPARMEPALRHITTAGPFEVASIPGDFDPLERLLLAQRLIREGFLIVVSATRD